MESCVEFQQALGLHREGRTEEAARAYELILRGDPAHSGALIRLGSLHLMQGAAAEAEALLRRAVAALPDSADAHANLAAALQRQGHLDEAITHYERAVALNPALLDARFAFAVCLQRSGRSEQALTCYETLLQARPDHVEANYGLGMLLVELGRSVEATRQFRAAVAADPEFAEAHYELGRLLSQDHASRRAISCFRKALEIDPDYTEARLALANALAQLDRNDEAMEAFRAVLAAEPDSAEAHRGIDSLLDRQRQRMENPGDPLVVPFAAEDDVGAQAAILKTMCERYQHAEALALARRLAAQRPESADFACMVGAILAQTGAIDDALAEFRRAYALAPEQLEIALQLIEFSKIGPEDEIFRRLEAVLPRIASLPPAERCMVHFGLAKAYRDLGEPDRGFAHLLQGNAVYRSQIDYDEAATLAEMDDLARVFNAGLVEARKGLGDPSTVPVFILGMPRSGTTLVEQILASHSAVFGAGELTVLRDLLERTVAAQLGGGKFPEILWTMPGAALRQMGTNYVTELRTLVPDAPRITDKLPSNFMFAGLIHLILPNVRIIHLKRDPVDTCLSCFATLFAGIQPFTYDLAELGRYHRRYQQLMAHWRKVLPTGAMLEVEYETLVQDFAVQARRIVAYCGLDWDPACLEFHKTSRPVATASLQQVRQPIYRSSVGRWRPDPVLLRPLLDALDGR